MSDLVLEERRALPHSVDKEGVQDTGFYEQRKALLRERERDQMSLSRWADSQVSLCSVIHNDIPNVLLTCIFRCEQWHPLCDLLISAAMPTLKQLAPDREYWAILHDYLHTPSYRLRLFASGPHSEIVANFEEESTNTGAYTNMRLGLSFL